MDKVCFVHKLPCGDKRKQQHRLNSLLGTVMQKL